MLKIFSFAKNQFYNLIMEQIIEQDNNNELDTIADSEISPRAYSLVWKHFRIENEKAKCIYCS